MQFTIGVKQIVGETWGPHGPRAAGSGFWLPTLEFPELGYEWLGPEAYKGVEPALIHLIADASGDRSFAVPDLLERMREEIAREVGRWLDNIEERRSMGIAGAEERARKRQAESGHIYTTLSIDCGACSRWDSLVERDMADAVEEAKRKGWRYTSGHGWVCEHHKLREDQ